MINKITSIVIALIGLAMLWMGGELLLAGGSFFMSSWRWVCWPRP
ncbi:hypothetical protein SODG_002059 [Sodalis praecaptivus]